jgi:hypothetical protein
MLNLRLNSAAAELEVSIHRQPSSEAVNQAICLVTLFVGACGWLIASNAKAAPEIAAVTEPACNGEVIVLSGEGFDPASTRVMAAALGEDDNDFYPQESHDPAEYLNALDRRPPLPKTPPESALSCEVLGGDGRWLHARMCCSRRSWVRVPATAVLWAGNDAGWSRPYVVNRPQAQWLSPTSAAPGEAIRIFGRTFAWGWQIEPAVGYIREVGGGVPIRLRRAPEHREDGHTERWCLSAWLSEDLEPGEYEVSVHARHGGPWGWSEPIRLRVEPEPTVSGPVVNVREQGAKGDGLTDDTEALQKAVTLAAEQKGIVFLPAGIYAISRTLSLPPGTVFRGQTAQTTTITNHREQSLRPGLATDRTRQVFHPAMVYVPDGRTVVQDVTLRFMPATAPVMQVGRDMAWAEDVSLYRVMFEGRQ